MNYNSLHCRHPSARQLRMAVNLMGVSAACRKASPRRDAAAAAGRDADQDAPPASSSRNAASSSTLTPSFSALASLLPAFSPASR